VKNEHGVTLPTSDFIG